MEASSKAIEPMTELLERMFAERERVHKEQMERLDAISDALRELEKVVPGGEKDNG